ncbi:MAG: DinB family protein [Chloroflexi bacterium]|nr:DinB family protein [Chloroflexota bacterium]
MDFAYCVEQLTTNAQTIEALCAGLPADHARWKPDAGRWSVLEVMGHLVDEEREDFRPFITTTFQGKPKTPHDPGAWILERGYNQRDLGGLVTQFREERDRSLEWLHTQADADWSTAVPFSKWFGFRAGDVLASWVAHDLLHLRQLVELKYGYIAIALARYDIQYAGEW